MAISTRASGLTCPDGEMSWNVDTKSGPGNWIERQNAVDLVSPPPEPNGYDALNYFGPAPVRNGAQVGVDRKFCFA